MERSDPAKPQTAAAMLRGNPLDNNSVLARLALATDPANEGLSLLTRAAPRPRDAIGAGRACAGASKAVKAALAFLRKPVVAANVCGEQLHALDVRLTSELDVSQTGEHIGARGRRLTNFPAWGMCIALGANEAAIAGLIAGGLLILWAGHSRRPVPFAQAKAVIAHGVHCELGPDDLRALLDGDQDIADTEWPWLAWLQRRWPAMRNAFEDEGGPPPPAPSFETRARGQLFARAHYASPARRAGVPTHRDLSEDQYRQACAQVSQWIEADDWRGAYAFVAATSSFTVDLAALLPLADSLKETWVATLDLEAGTQRFDLSFLAEEAAATPASGSFVPADLIVEKPLPESLARNMQARRARLPGAKTFGELYPEAPSDLSGYMALIDGGGEITISWARWTNSAGIYMRHGGMDNFLAYIESCDFGHAPRSKLYYAVVSRSEIWAAAAKYFEQAGWGEPMADRGGGVAFGSRVVSTQEGLCRAAEWHRIKAASMRPARSDRSVAKLLEYHNRYTRLIAFELGILLALREDREYEIWADIDDADFWVEIRDKSVPGPDGALPVPLSERAKAAIHAYRVHCKAVAERLVSMGLAQTAVHQWLLAVERRERVALMCVAAGPDRILPAGSGDAIGVLPTHLAVAPDVGRKWLENALRHAGLRTADIDGMLRHEVVGQSRSSCTSDFIVLEWALRVAAVVDAAAASILGRPTPGLARR